MRHPLNSVGPATKAALAAFVAASVGAAALIAGPPAARAQQAAVEALQVSANKAAIVRLARQAQNVIVGDPRIADITVENRSMLVLFGRAPGETNLIVLDSKNREILSVPVVVTAEKDRQVSVIAITKSGVTEVVYSCVERCVKLTEQTAAMPTGGSGGQAPPSDTVPPGAPAPAAQPDAAAPAPASTPAQAPSGGTYKR